MNKLKTFIIALSALLLVQSCSNYNSSSLNMQTSEITEENIYPTITNNSTQNTGYGESLKARKSHGTIVNVYQNVQPQEEKSCKCKISGCCCICSTFGIFLILGIVGYFVAAYAFGVLPKIPIKS